MASRTLRSSKAARRGACAHRRAGRCSRSQLDGVGDLAGLQILDGREHGRVRVSERTKEPELADRLRRGALPSVLALGLHHRGALKSRPCAPRGEPGGAGAHLRVVLADGAQENLREVSDSGLRNLSRFFSKYALTSVSVRPQKILRSNPAHEDELLRISPRTTAARPRRHARSVNRRLQLFERLQALRLHHFEHRR